MRWLLLLPVILAAVAHRAGAPEIVTALAALPALLVCPGLPIAARLSDDALDRALLAFWISAALCVPAVLVGAWTGVGATATLAFAGTVTTFGLLAPFRPAHPIAGPARLGAAAVVVAVAAVGWTWRDTVARPLDGSWWYPPAEEGWDEAGDPPEKPPIGDGWLQVRPAGWPDSGAFALVPGGASPMLAGPAHGKIVLAVRGPVGASLAVAGKEAVVTAAVQEQADEGLVDRYLERGVAGVTVDLDLAAGQSLPLTLTDPAASTVYLLAGPEAVWSLHAAGELRFVHYYQLLNMVEQLHWARELYADRRVTDVQPPLPSYVLAAPLAVTRGEMPTADLLFLLELALVGLAGVGAIRAWAPRAPALAFLLPAAACAEHAKLLLEAGSGMMPDTLYTLALVGAVATLARPRGPYVVLGLLAQLCRYPGGVVAGIAGILAGSPRRVVALAAAIVGTVLLFVAGGAVSGSLAGWKETVWWETFPEHWHGEGDPAVLLARAPRFYGLWLAYAGGTPILAALRWPRGTRVALGTAVLYSLLLCTIDHTPSHYFLPLVQLAAVAAACTAAELRHPVLRLAFPSAALVGLCVAYELVPVVG